MTRKKVDDRIRTLITNSVKQHHRSLFVIVGDNGKDQVPNLHYILSKAQVKARPSVLWCYKNELGFSTHKKKRMRQIKKMVQRGLYDPSKDDPFELFVASTEVRWSYYRDSHKVLGQTYGMCVLQDFEALTPNLLARTVETVEGGGIVVILLRTMNSLRQLFSMTMDVHSRFRTENYNVVQPRFNERFILSLSSCKSCAIIDDELNILPLSKHIRKIEPVELDEDEQGQVTKRIDPELVQLKRSLEDTQPAGALVGLARTRDQAKAILTFIEAVSEKTLRSTVALTAARGRGKSAALGVAIASAVAYGYSNIFVTSPSPDNLTTVFEFVFKALDALKYKEHMDYEIIQSTNPDFNKAVVRVNLFHDHRQTIQYIQPQDHEMLAQAELVVIDEAAAIPLPLVRKLIGPYLVFLSSTVNGYEGTGRSLSLKLLDQLRKRTAESVTKSADWRTNEYMYKKSNENKNPWADSNAGSSTAGSLPKSTGTAGAVGGARVLREIELEEPIRYAQGDEVEKWLYHVLCLDSTKLKYRLISGTPHPQDCELFAVDRDALFSHHKMSEKMLQRIMALYVASHYKNSPNDLQLLSDAPAHRLFVLLGKKQSREAGERGELPDVLCVVQVALEGGISKQTVKSQLAQGARAAGDLVPWMVSQQFQDPEFGNLNGARVVRISTHPDVTRMGYGQRALDLLTKFYSGKLTSLSEEEATQVAFESRTRPAVTAADGNLAKEKLKPRAGELSLLVPIEELAPPRMHYMSVSFGVTEGLFSFWEKSGMKPCYLRQTPNELTGEHSCIMLNALDCSGISQAPEPHWEDSLCADFQRRFLSLLGSAFRDMSCSLAYSIALASSTAKDQAELSEPTRMVVNASSLEGMFLPHDLKRLEAYARSLVDYHMVADLLPTLARLFFENRVPGGMTLSNLQRALLVGMGLQGKTVDKMGEELGMPATQLLALFNKSIRKFSEKFRKVMEDKIKTDMDSSDATKSAKKVKKKMDAAVPLGASLSQEQEADGDEAIEEFKKNQKASLEGLDLDEYIIDGNSKAWEDALNKAKGGKSGMLSVKSSKKRSTKSVLDELEESAETPKSKKRKSKGGLDEDDGLSYKESQKAKFSNRKSGKKHRRRK